MDGVLGNGSQPVNLLLSLGLLSVASFVVVMMTSFVRIVIVLSLVRSALGTQTVPPNMVITGLALVLTLITMMPTLRQINTQAVVPYQSHQIEQKDLIRRVVAPMQSFMLRQTQKTDLTYFGTVSHASVSDPSRAPLYVVVPAFVVGELRAGFAIGLALYLPFIAIDLAVSAILMGLGMMMLSPNIVSLPIKLLLFVTVNGWALVCGNLVQSFRQ